MKRVLERISWETRKWNFKINLFSLLLHSEFNAWGFSLFKISLNHKEYSLLEFKFRLPDKTTVREFTIDDWDILFMRTFIWKRLDALDEKILWRRGDGATKWEKVQLKIYHKLFK